MGYLHDDVILPLLPEWFSVLLFKFVVQIRPTVVWNLTGMAKFKYEKKNYMDSGSIGNYAIVQMAY